MGIEYMMLHTLTPDLEHLDLFAKYIVEAFASATAARGTDSIEVQSSGHPEDLRCTNLQDLGSTELVRGGPGL